jgi:formylmethanofuran dehydrogenase subunit E
VEKLKHLLKLSAARHHRLCPRQVLGVRIGMLAGKCLGLELPQSDKRLFAFAECDGCGMGGMAVATGCFVERRTMRVLDYGKLAGTFVDTQTGEAVRIHPRPDSRLIAERLQPGCPDSWQAQLAAYQVLPDDQLLVARRVKLAVSLEAIISQPGMRVECAICGEEVTNERWVIQEGNTICRTCAGGGYFRLVD